jgi:hypothetical protein
MPLTPKQPSPSPLSIFMKDLMKDLMAQPSEIDLVEDNANSSSESLYTCRSRHSSHHSRNSGNKVNERWELQRQRGMSITDVSTATIVSASR